MIMDPLNITAIDPGPKQSTYVCLTFTGENRLLDSPMIITGVGALNNPDMLEKLHNSFGSLFVCEMIACYGLAVGKEVFETVRWIGRFEERLSMRGAKLETLTRMECKMNLCHSSRAKDANIRQALIDRFGEPGTKQNIGCLYGIKNHAWAALAVGVTYHDKSCETLKEKKRQEELARSADYGRNPCALHGGQTSSTQG